MRVRRRRLSACRLRLSALPVPEPSATIRANPPPKTVTVSKLAHPLPLLVETRAGLPRKCCVNLFFLPFGNRTEAIAGSQCPLSGWPDHLLPTEDTACAPKNVHNQPEAPARATASPPLLARRAGFSQRNLLRTCHTSCLPEPRPSGSGPSSVCVHSARSRSRLGGHFH